MFFRIIGLVFFLMIVLALTDLSTVSESMGESAEVKKAAKETPQKVSVRRDRSEGEKNGCFVDQGILDDLKKQRVALKKRETELAEFEKELKAREDSVNEQLQDVKRVRQEVAGIRGEEKKEFSTRVEKLVQAVEKMSPKAASALLARLDDDLAVATISKMSVVKLAKVMNIMAPNRSTELTELMALGKVSKKSHRQRIPAGGKSK